jgi:hypothetical protein
MMRALLIRRPWIDLILDGKKTWEIRGSGTLIRETIGLIASGSGTVIGVCDLVDCIGPLTIAEFGRNAAKAAMSKADARSGSGYRRTYAWVLDKPRRLKRPIQYEHPSGAVIWVRLDGSTERAIGRLIKEGKDGALEHHCGRA